MVKCNYGYGSPSNSCATYSVVQTNPFNAVLDHFRAANDKEIRLALAGMSCKQKAKEVENWVREKLIRLGIPLNLEGYHYLLTGILLSYQDGTLLTRVTKSLYPVIAKKYMTNASCVERNMRSAIEQSRHLGYFNEMYDFEVANEFYKPANKLFINLLLTKVRARFGAYED